MTDPDEMGAVSRILEADDLVVIEHGITIASYIDTEGERSMAIKCHGDPYLGETLGMMELAKHFLLVSGVEEG